MKPYVSSKEIRVGSDRPKIQHLAAHPEQRRTRRERQAEKEAVAAERRAMKKSARRQLKEQMLAEIE